MRLYLSGLRIMAFIFCLPCFTVPTFAKTYPPTAVAGLLDLTDCSEEKIRHLDGEWLFITENKTDPNLLRVPGNWREITGTPNSSGEYILRIKLPETASGKIGGLIIPELSQALEVRVNNRIVFSSGNMETGTADFTRNLIPFIMESEILISIKLKNSHFRNGGLFYVPLFGDFEQLKRHRETKFFIEALIMGGFLMVAIYHLMLFAWRYQNTSALYLGIAALLMIFRGLTTGENPIAILFPGFPWILDYRIEYISAYLTAVALLHFLDMTFPFRHRFVQSAISAVSGCIFAFSLITLVLPAAYISKTIYVLQGCMLSCFLLGLAIIIHAYKERKPASKLFFWGGVISILLFFADCAYYLLFPIGILNSGLSGMLIFLLVQTLVLSRIHGNAFLRAERLTHTLEDEVSKRTADLEETNRSLEEEITQRKRIEERLTVLSTTDPLTGAANRNKMDALLEQNHKIFIRYKTGYGLIMFDVDHFKRVNDQYGHDVGDLVLKRIVTITNDAIRKCDVLARWGGEEFLTLMPTLEIEGTISAAERIRLALEKEKHPEVGLVTASFGAGVPRENETMKDLLARLDGYLYKAKREGRNRVIHQ